MTILKKVIGFIFLFSAITFSQNKLFTMEDVVINSYSKLAPETNRTLQWIPNSNEYSYVNSKIDKNTVLKSNLTSSIDTIYTLSQLNNILTKNGFEEIKRLPRSKWLNAETIRFTEKGSVFQYNYKTKHLSFTNKIDKEAQNVSFAPNNVYAAYTIDNNLYAAFNPLESVTITKDENKGIVNGQIVHRNEFGIDRGIFWSPKSNYIAYYRKDETMVADYPLVDVTTTPAHLKNIKYPMAGQKSHHVKLGIYNIVSGQTVWMKTGMPLDHYLTCITWEPSEKYIYIAILNRDQNHLSLNKYDATTGQMVKALFEETDTKYVQPLHPMYFIPNEPNNFLWFSRKDGWNHLYKYNTNGRLLQRLTKGKWEVLNINGFDDNDNVFVTATKDGIMDRNFYKVDLSDGGIERITKTQGWHSVKPNSNGKYFIDS